MKLSPKAQKALDRVVARFQAGDLGPIVKVATIKLPDDAPLRRWSLCNKVLAFVQTGSLDCRGYRQWQDAGRQVKKGASAAFIIGPMKVKSQGKDGDDEYKLIGFRTIPVHPYQNTEGDGDGALTYEPKELPPLADVAERLGVSVEYMPLAPGIGGYCDADGKSIAAGSGDPAVWFHELAHSIHAKLDGKLKGGQHGDQETVADFTAAVLMELYGLGDRTGNTWKYIEKYSDDPLNAILKALGTVEKVLGVLEGNT